LELAPRKHCRARQAALSLRRRAALRRGARRSSHFRLGHLGHAEPDPVGEAVNNSAADARFGALKATPAAEMAAFDSLPFALRALLNYSTLDYSALQLARESAGGVRRIGAIAIETPDRRNRIVAEIEAMNAAHGGPLNASRTQKFAHATLRREPPVACSRPVFRRS